MHGRRRRLPASAPRPAKGGRSGRLGGPRGPSPQRRRVPASGQPLAPARTPPGRSIFCQPWPARRGGRRPPTRRCTPRRRWKTRRRRRRSWRANPRKVTSNFPARARRSRRWQPSTRQAPRRAVASRAKRLRSRLWRAERTARASRATTSSSHSSGSPCSTTAALWALTRTTVRATTAAMPTRIAPRRSPEMRPALADLAGSGCRPGRARRRVGRTLARSA
mmetsp:Transcript_22850/g.65961  ORF Transcript_22850/g.65961 Transcript_22850/m.65961 type:complete len:221 (+) Transcript_22850:209-871(+)